MMLVGKSGEEKTIWCYRLCRVILLELNMLTLKMRDWTSQINSMRVGTLACLIVVGWYQSLGGMSWPFIHCPWHQYELGVSGIKEKTGVTDHCGYMWVCPYWCMWVWMGSGSRNFSVRHYMFVQSGYVSLNWFMWIWRRGSNKIKTQMPVSQKMLPFF